MTKLRPRSTTRLPALLGLAAVLAAAPALAEGPAAIIEEIESSAAGLEAMEYLESGRVIALDESEFVVLGYLDSCVRETVIGGKITVGASQSEVAEGTVAREVVACDQGHSDLTANQQEGIGTIILRTGNETVELDVEREPVRIYSRTPVFTFADPVEAITITALDGPTETLTLAATPRGLDLQGTGHSLRPGIRYEVRAGGRSTTFEIQDDARPEGGPVISRLVRM